MHVSFMDAVSENMLYFSFLHGFVTKQKFFLAICLPTKQDNHI